MSNKIGTKVLLNNYRQLISEQQIQYPNDIQRAINYIHTYCFDEKLNINLLKEVCKINRKCFSARFKRFTNRYPKEYILHHRIEAGKILLRETDESITLVAIELGFRSNSSFCKAFSNVTALSPSEWRSTNKS
ncbi:helix-turn-helix domain-containing protein [Gracilimonas amylolytica]|uniref:helix-turn-helix domain-containing protein n=1 Tax=Gracilimonas amylolytica TaxID=1749045 RepID=UPI000CD8F717|nr:AraC family transcriptional regulator [Gracilimonas amylolytica]